MYLHNQVDDKNLIGKELKISGSKSSSVSIADENYDVVTYPANKITPPTILLPSSEGILNQGKFYLCN